MPAPRPSSTLGEIAERHGLELRGDPAVRIDGVCALSPGRPGHLGFCADPKLRSLLSSSAASAVIVRIGDVGAFSGSVLIAADPAVAFVGIAREFDRAEEFPAVIHAQAMVDPTASIGEGCGIGPGAVIEAEASIAAGSYIGPNCVVRRGARIGAGSRLESQVYVGPDCVLGARTHVLPGAVIGGRGFGLARTSAGWIEVPQLGRVVIGDDVEIGANTCIDRGALDDTVIGDGVKIDNQVQIGHNVHIGSGTAIAACVGIAGSTEIGRNCMIGGAAGIGGHLRICDNVVLLAMSMVVNSIKVPGAYGSGLPAEPARQWRRDVARVKRLAKLGERLAAVEKQLKIMPESAGEHGEQGDL